MGKDNNLHDYLSDLADAIREKKGTSEPINAQSFAEEIASLETNSPFAVDFGEEIATMDSYPLDSLREDIDYYNEIQRKRASGEVKDNKLVDDAEFKKRIAWWPKGLGNTNKAVNCTNLRILPPMSLTSLYNNGGIFKHLARFAPDVRACTRGGYNLYRGVIDEIELNLEACTSIDGYFIRDIFCKSIIVNLPLVTKINGGDFYQIDGLRYVNVSIPKVTSLYNNFRSTATEELHLDISSVTQQSYSIGYNTSELKIAHIKGLQVTLTLNNHANMQTESVKYMLDNCKAREDGAAYTLTLNSAVKTAFLAKCDEDAEYAASLANANAKGLTLA